MLLNSNLYGLCGQIKNGKDETGNIINYIASNDNPTFENYINRKPYTPIYDIKKFADKLKDIVCIILSCTREELEDRSFKDKELGPEWWYYSFDNKMLIPYLEAQYEKINEVVNNLIKLTPRKMLQLLGTEGGRKLIHPNIWVNSTMSDYNFDINKWIITDVRFANEAYSIEKNKGIVIGIKRKFKLRFPKYAELEIESDPYAIPEKLSLIDFELYKNLTHESELSISDYDFCDFIVENNGSIEDLYYKIYNIIKL